MDAYSDLLEKIGVLSNKQPLEGDYISEEDGLLRCGVCGEPKQAVKAWLGNPPQVVGVVCSCYAKAQEERKRLERERETKRRIAFLRKRGVTDKLYTQNIFSCDSNPAGKVSQIARRYVDNWEYMREFGTGILLYGPPGTGKSFYAGCIANALIDKGVFAFITSIAKILDFTGGYEDGGIMKSEIANADLLVLDDLGTERDTSYAAEKVFEIIDLRYRTRKPLIVTTNLTTQELSSQEISRRRIYERVTEMCDIRLKMDGENRRKQRTEEKRKAAAELLLQGVV